MKIASKIQECSEKDSVERLDSKIIDDLSNQLAWYENTENSEVCTVINTSILPYSHETTEREFSPMSVSPLISPRLPFTDRVTSVISTTEATIYKKKCQMDRPPKILISEERESSSEYKSNDESFEETNLDSNNYLKKHRGDDDNSPSFIFSDTHSHQSSINHSNLPTII